jgi:hypothetical protein
MRVQMTTDGHKAYLDAVEGGANAQVPSKSALRVAQI